MGVKKNGLARARVGFIRNRRTTVFLFVLMILKLCVVVGGCRWLSPECEVAVRLPELPAHWRAAYPSPEWTLLVPHSGRSAGRFAFAEELETEDGSWIKLSAGADTALIRLPKGRNLPVLGFVAEHLLPAGALFPLDSDDSGRLWLTWEGGPPAVVIAALADSGWDTGVFNADRLRSEMRETGGGDPWLIDLDLAVGTLWFGTFSASRLRSIPEYLIDLPAGAGRWIPDDPFRCAVDGTFDGIIHGCPVREGYSRFYNIDTGKKVRVYVSDGEWSLVSDSPWKD
jgi:hypothetical protein